MKTFSSAVLEPRSYGAEAMENNVHDWQTSYCSIKHGTQEERDPSHLEHGVHQLQFKVMKESNMVCNQAN